MSRTFGSPREYPCLSNKKESFAMQAPRSAPSTRVGAILSLLGGALVIYGVCFLPLAIGNGGGSFTPHSEWEVANFFFHYMCGPTSLVVALPLLLVLVVLGMSVANLFHELSPGMVQWRYRAALAALVMQGVLGLFMVFIYTFGFDFGAGFWLVLLGFVVMTVGTFLNRSLQIHAEGRKRT
jgi:hypothetical protein